MEVILWRTVRKITDGTNEMVTSVKWGWAAVASMPGAAPWQTYPICLTTSSVREGFKAALERRGIETRRYYMPSLTTGYVGRAPIARGVCPVSEDLAQRMLCPPVYESLTANEEMYLFDNVAAACAEQAS